MEQNLTEHGTLFQPCAIGCNSQVSKKFDNRLKITIKELMEPAWQEKEKKRDAKCKNFIIFFW